MKLSSHQVDILLRLVGLTRRDEIDCDTCLARLAEFAESEIAGRSVPESLEALRHHLEVCGDCAEEYRALRSALEALGEGDTPR